MKGIIDNTLREGEQLPGVAFTCKEKLDILELLDRSGIAIADITMFGVHEREMDFVEEASRIKKRIQLGISVRAIEKEIEGCFKLPVDELFIIFPVSPIHIRKKLNLTEEKLLERLKNILASFSKEKKKLNIVAEDASRADTDFMKKFTEISIELKAPTILFCDTVSVLYPRKTYELVKSWLDMCAGNIETGVHFHNDFGLSTANTLIAIEMGVDYPSVTISGIGERGGNASLEEIVLGMENLLGIDPGVDKKILQLIADKTERYSGIIISPNKPITGLFPYTHESGIHVDGIMKDASTYEPINPEDVGRKRQLVIGKHSGIKGMLNILKNTDVNTVDLDLNGFLSKLILKLVDTRRKKINRLINAYHGEWGRRLNLWKAVLEEISKRTGK